MLFKNKRILFPRAHINESTPCIAGYLPLVRTFGINMCKTLNLVNLRFLGIYSIWYYLSVYYNNHKVALLYPFSSKKWNMFISINWKGYVCKGIGFVSNRLEKRAGNGQQRCFPTWRCSKHCSKKNR
jgi:hypothetical protein